MKRNILDATKLIDTLDQLCMRIEERFPGSSLYKVARQVHDIGKETDEVTGWIKKPNIWLRILVGGFIAAILLTLGYGLSKVQWTHSSFTVGDIVQIGEAGLNEIVILGAAVLFLVSIENKSKRKKVVQAINRLRSFAHIIDAHQLTKDPHSILEQKKNTAHSPKRKLTPYELGRYLDYCSELLSLTGKIGFLHAQAFDDPMTVQAVNELESLVNGLSQKIWQKIMIIQNSQTVQQPRKQRTRSKVNREPDATKESKTKNGEPARGNRSNTRRRNKKNDRVDAG